MSLFTRTKTSSLMLTCDSGLAYDILTDYDSYSDWMPHVTRSKLLAREGDLAIAEFEMSHPRQDKFALECIHTRNKMVLTRTISGGIPVSQFEWTIEPSGEGCKVTLAIEAKTNWHRFVPGYSFLMNPARCLKSLQSQASTFGGDISIQGEGGETVLEVIETDEGLFCWLRGKKYSLTPVPGGSHD